MRGERFSTPEEIKDFLHPLGVGHGGLVAFEEDGIKYVEDSEYHQLVLGSTGVGKTWFMIMSQVRSIIESGRNGIIIDAKGEIHRNTACYAANQGYDIRVVDFRHFRGQRYNPLSYPKALYDAGEKGKAQEQVQEIVLNLVQSVGRNVDPFWINAERSLLSGCINLLIETAAIEDCTFSNIISLINEDWNSLETEGREIVDNGSFSEIVNMLPYDSAAKAQLLNYIGTKATITKSCIMSETLGTLAKFCITRESVAMTSKDDLDIFNLDTPVGKPFMLYIILPDDSNVHNDLAGILICQLINRLVRLADSSKYSGKLPVQVNMILEELGNVGAAISGLPFLLTASRSRNIKMTLSLQALYQLNSIFGDSKAATILSCVDTLVCFRTSDWNTLCEISNKCGNKIVQSGDIRFMQPLLSEPQLMSLKTGQALILLGGGRVKYVETFKLYKDLFDCSDLEEIPVPKIEEHKIIKPVRFSDLKSRITKKDRDEALPKRQISPFKQTFDKYFGGESDD